jgi:hypothetical protein
MVVPIVVVSSIMTNMNLSKIVCLLYDNHQLSLAHIARLINLNKSTIFYQERKLIHRRFNFQNQLEF